MRTLNPCIVGVVPTQLRELYDSSMVAEHFSVPHYHSWHRIRRPRTRAPIADTLLGVAAMR